MPEHTKLPEEAHPLQQWQPRAGNTLETNEEIGETSRESQAPPPGFIYRPWSPQSPDNPYTTQPPYNPTYKLFDDTIVPQMTDIELASTALYPNVQEEVPPETQKDSCGSQCAIVCLIAIVIGTMAWVVYLLSKNPKIARTLQRIITEARKPRPDDPEESKPLFRRMFTPVIASEVTKLINETAWI